MKKYPVTLGVLLIGGLGLFAQEAPKKWDVCLMVGPGFASATGGSQFSRTWAFYYLSPINETTAITPAGKSAFALTAAISYYFSPNFGVQVGTGFLTRGNTVASDWNLNWHWTDTDEAFSDDGSFPDTRSRLTTVPLFANIIGRYRLGMFKVFGSAGPAVYFNSFKADAFSIYADSFYSNQPWGWEQAFDAFQVSLRTDTSWVSLGFNAGAGLDIRISRRATFAIEARYFSSPAKDLDWGWTTGTYDGIYGIWSGYSLSVAAAQAALGMTTAQRVNPSLFSIMGGFRFDF
jgi:opacity protein-like surface antigen